MVVLAIKFQSISSFLQGPLPPLLIVKITFFACRGGQKKNTLRSKHSNTDLEKTTLVNHLPACYNARASVDPLGGGSMSGLHHSIQENKADCK